MKGSAPKRLNIFLYFGTFSNSLNFCFSLKLQVPRSIQSFELLSLLKSHLSFSQELLELGIIPKEDCVLQMVSDCEMS